MDDLDILGAFMSLLRTAKELDRLSSKGLEHWPTYTAKLKKDDGEATFQLTPLTHVARAKSTTRQIVSNTVPLSPAA